MKPARSHDIELLKQTLENITDPVWVCALPDHSIEYMNEEVTEKLLGYPADCYYADKNFGFSLIVEEDIPTALKANEECFKNGKAEANYRLRKKDGTIFWAKIRLKIIKDSKGVPVRLIGTTTDITSKMKVRHELEESRHSYFQVLDAIPDFVLVKDAGSKIRWANKAFRDYYGMSNEQLKDIIDAPFSEPDYTQKYVQDDAYVYSTGKTLDIACEPVKRFDGLVHYFHTIKAPIFDKNNKVILTVGVSRDITHRLEAEKKLSDQRQSMITSAKMASLGEMAGGIAHEINNPLAIIIGKADSLKKLIHKPELDKELLDKNLDKLVATAHRISRIIKGLKTFSRSDANDAFIATKAASVVDDTLGLCQEKLKNSGVEVHIDIPTDLEFDCRATQISQILLNLINNSYDAIQNLSEKWIRVSVEESVNGTIRFSVTDSGPGIPKEIADKLMQPFFTTKEVGKGTGIGLSISRGIAQDHYGTLFLDRSAPNTCFVLELPLKQKQFITKQAA